MSRLTWFLGGIVLGAAGMLVALKYHVVHADDGIHFVPKATAELSVPYVDIRHFEFSDWSERRELALAIVRAEKSYLLKDARATGLQQAMEGVLEQLRSPRR